jgi:Glycosyltransferase family 87
MGIPILKPETTDARCPRPWPLAAPVVALAFLVAWTALYANASSAVTRPADYRFFPPFEPGFDRNRNDHLGAEYYAIARSLYEGRGFADPFRSQTGPTAWMPPVLPGLLAALLWATGGDRDAVMNAVVCAQAASLVAAGVFVLWFTRRTVPGVSRWAAVGVYAALLLAHFALAFQETHDSWLILLALTLVLAGACAARPLGSAARAAAWGAVGGLAALISPVVGFVWGVLTVAEPVRTRSAGRLLLAGAAAALALTPWTLRNYQAYGRLIPVKSNLAYELYQSQCLEPDGLLRLTELLRHHPYNGPNAEAEAYRRLGETAYLDGKAAAFRSAVAADPWDFAGKVGNRFLAATLVYTPMNPRGEDRAYWGLWISRVTHALPFLSAVLLLATARSFGLRREQGVVLLAYAAYLLPFVLVSYYDRYAFPLVGVHALLMLCAGERLTRLTGQWVEGPVPPAPGPPPTGAPRGPRMHRWAAGLLVCGGLWWWYGGDFLERLDGPKYDRGGNTVVIPDFFQEWYSARLWWEGRPVYTSLRTGDHHLNLPPGVTGHFFEWNAHPPGAILVALPLGRLDFRDALPAWNLVSLWALAGSVLLVVSRLGSPVPGWAVAPAVTALLLTNPFWTQITHGQLNLVLLLLFVGAWAADRAGRVALAGCLVGAAAVIKLFPAYLLVYFVLSRRWRGLVAGLLSIVTGVVLTSAILGWDVWYVYFTEVVPHTKEYATIWVNASLPGFWLKLFDPAMSWFVFHPWPIVRDRGLATAAALASAAAVTALLWWRTRPGKPAADPDARFAATVVACLLLSPTTWDHYFLLLLLPVVLLMRRLPAGWPRLALWAVLVVLAASPYRLAGTGMLLAGVSADRPGGGWESPPWLTATALSIQTHALLVLFGLLLFGRRFTDDRPTEPPAAVTASRTITN